MSKQTDLKELTDWADVESQRLRQVRGLYEALGTARFGLPHVAAALEFLRRHAPGSSFSRSAEELFEKEGRMSAQATVRGVADILDAWSRSTSESWAATLPFEVQARIEAATDLMEQVQRLLDDSKVHPAAPIVLAGAALEEFLRSQITAKGLISSGKPGINTYATALQQDGGLSRQEVKNITSWAGLRNHAAHGEWDQISREEARIMVMGVNLFLQQHALTP